MLTRSSKTNHRSDVLEDIYFASRSNANWLKTVKETFSLSESDVQFLEELDDILLTQNANEAHWIRQFQSWDPELILAENDEEKLSVISRKIFEANRDYEEMARKNDDIFSRRLMLALRGVDVLERERRRIRARSCHTHSGAFQVTEADICRAREYPLQKLLGTSKNYILCPFHQDSRPSMWLRNGWGYCFSCGESCDSIRWLMAIEHKTFPEAVKLLISNF